MRENFQDDNESISSFSSHNNSPHIFEPSKKKLLNEANSLNKANNTTNFESDNNSITKIPNFNRINYYNQPRNYKSPLMFNNENNTIYNSFPEQEIKGYKRNLTIDEFIPANTTTWNKIIDFFFNW